MGDRVAVNPGRVQQASKSFHDLSDLARRTNENLHKALAAAGECWGNDKIGKSFADNYVETSKSVPATLNTFVESMKNKAADVDAMAKGYAKREDDAEVAATKI